jgi:RNA polymerase sigma-70 factor (ECF subfamily)
VGPNNVNAEMERAAREAEALVEAARAGDAGSFDALVRRYRPRVYALALHLSASRSEADDITQDVFLKAFSHIDRFQGRSQFFTWLYRITMNRALNARRDARRRRALPMDDPRVIAAVAVDAGDNPRLAVELRESYGLLVEALDRLSPLLRTTVVLVALQGFSHKEAAVVLDTTEGTVAWRIHDARRRMLQTLEQLHRDPTPLPVPRRMISAEQLLSQLALLVPSLPPAR